MMAVDSQEHILSMTPPSSELDEFEKSTGLTCSPSILPGFTYPSPAPSHHGHAPSVSSDPIFSLFPRVPMSSDGRNHDLQHLSFEDASSDSASFALPPGSDPSMASYSMAPSAANPYAMYAQNTWFPYSTYPQQVPMLPYDPNSSPPFTGYSQPPTQPGLANIIPPTPRDNHTMSFDFNAPAATLPANHHLVASPSFSQVSRHSSHSHRSSVPSLSRSCSPVPSVQDVSGGAYSMESMTLRPPIRSASTSSSNSLHTYGIPVIEPASMLGNSFSPTSSPAQQVGNANGMRSWRCAYPGCTSRATFTRGCDLRKHYNRHSKHLFCRVEGCPQSETAAASRATSDDQRLTGGFSSKKDRARHEAKHNPGIKCEWRGTNGEQCTRVFSRMDNMKDHVRRIHNKAAGGGGGGGSSSSSSSVRLQANSQA